VLEIVEHQQQVLWVKILDKLLRWARPARAMRVRAALAVASGLVAWIIDR
jgi:hypothetical protein